jgi:hypothetical protein
MSKKIKVAAITMGIALLAGPATAKILVDSRCAKCHEIESSDIRGTIVPGSQTDTTVKIKADEDIWQVRYDKKSKLNSFMSARELRDEKAVSVQFRPDSDGWVYAEEMSYKPGYHFHTAENIVTIAEVAHALQESPKEGNYMIVDARGYDNFIEGHLPNAVNIPYYRLNEFKYRLPKDKSTQIYAYCRGFT